MQKAIWRMISTLITTATSSIRSESESHDDIWLLDCSMAYGHIMPVNTAATTATAITAAGFPKLCLRTKPRATNIISTIMTVSILQSLPLSVAGIVSRLAASLSYKNHKESHNRHRHSRYNGIIQHIGMPV